MAFVKSAIFPEIVVDIDVERCSIVNLLKISRTIVLYIQTYHYYTEAFSQENVISINCY